MTDPRPNTPPHAPPRDDTGVTTPDTAGPPPSRPGGAALSPGSTLGGYRIERVLGVGGMGAVYLAADPRLARRVAVKTMKPELAADPAAKERFLREARATAAVEHENVVVIHFVGEEGDTPYLVMPLLKGESLDDRLRRGPVPLGEACRIAREIAAGLAAAHATGLIHRDVKPSNTWLDPDGKVKLLDFGLARPAAAGENLTALGQVVGTPAYMAPEQARGQAVDARADLFSLGCVLYQMVTGRRPFTGETVLAILTSLAVDHPPAADRVNPQVPPELAHLIDRLLAKDPANRPASAKEVAAQLLLIEAGLNAGALRAIPLDGAPPGGPDWAALTESDPAIAHAPAAAPKAKPKPGGSPKWPLVAAGLAVLLAGAAAAVLYQQVVKVETPKGTLVIESDDPAVEVVVRKGGATIIDKTTKREIELAVGDYEIDLAEKKEGLKLSTKRFSITKGGKETVRVRLDPPAKPAVAPPAVEPTAPVPVVPVAAASPFDGLDPAKIPAEERLFGLPAGTIAVVGSHRGQYGPNPYSAARFSPDGRWLVRVGGGVLRIWDATTMQLKFSDGRPVQRGLAFSSDGKMLAVNQTREGDGRQGVRLIDVSEPEPKLLRDFGFRGENGTHSIAFFPNDKTVATGTGHGAVYLWEVDGAPDRPARVIRKEQGLQSEDVEHLAVSPDGSRLVAVCNKAEVRTARVFDLRAAEPRELFATPTSVRGWTALSPDGTTYVTVTGDNRAGEVTAWDLTGPATKRIGTAALPALLFVGPFTADGKRVKLGNELWGVDGGLRKLRDLPAHTVALSPDGTKVAQVESYRAVRVLDPDGKVLAEGATPVASVSHVPAAVGDKLLTFLDGNLWSVKDGALQPTPLNHPQFLNTNQFSRMMMGTALSADRRMVAGLGADTVVRVFDVDGTAIRERAKMSIGAHQNRPDEHIVVFALHPDGKTILTRRRDGSADLWDISQAPPARRPFGLLIPGQDYAWFTFAPDGRRLAVWGDGSVSVWDLTAAKPTARPLADVTGDKPLSAAFAADGRGLFVGYTSGAVRRFDPTAPARPGEVVIADAGKSGVWVSPSPDGRLLAAIVGSELKVWDLAAGKWAWSARLTDPYRVLSNVPVRWADGGRHLLVPQHGCVYVVRVAAPPVADADRKAAEYVLSIGGSVFVNGEEKQVTTKGQLPNGRFTLTGVTLVSNPKVTDEGLANFKDCKDLTHLNLGLIPITDAGLANFKDCKQLTLLHLSGTKVTDEGLAYFKDCKKMEILLLSNTPITDAGLTNFKDCKNLLKLSLENVTDVTDLGLANFKGCQNITRLRLDGLRMTDLGLSYFKDCKNLDFLTLRATQVGDAGLAQFKDCKALTYLDVRNTKVTPAMVAEFSKAQLRCKIEWDGRTVEPK